MDGSMLLHKKDTKLFGGKNVALCFSNTTGAECWLNSFLRLLGSMTIWPQLMGTYGPHYSETKLAKVFTQLLKLIENTDKPLSADSLKQTIFLTMKSSAADEKIRFDVNGQQSIPETFIIFLQLVSKGTMDFINNPFYHSHEISGVCECGHKLQKEDRKKIITHLTTADTNIEEAFKKRNIDVECIKCKKTIQAKESLIQTGSVVIFTSVPRVFPQYFNVKAGTKKWEYTLVSAIHHQGDVEGGHYYSTVLENEMYVTADDSTITRKNIDVNPTANQVMAVYELLKIQSD